MPKKIKADLPEVTGKQATTSVLAIVVGTTTSHITILNLLAITPSGNLSSTDVFAALNELQGDIDTINASRVNFLHSINGKTGGAGKLESVTTVGLSEGGPGSVVSYYDDDEEGTVTWILVDDAYVGPQVSPLDNGTSGLTWKRG